MQSRKVTRSTKKTVIDWERNHMRQLVTGGQMKAIDQYTIQNIGIPSLVLMERAAAAVADAAEREHGRLFGAAVPDQMAQGGSIWAVCGTGNNGADGIAAARMLHNKGYKVTVILVGNQERSTEEFQLQKSIAEKLDMHLIHWNDFLSGSCDILIDAVFGVGLTRPVEGHYLEVLRFMNSCGASKVIAVDMPSGIHSDNGRIMGQGVKADVTITFGYQKLGSVLYPGREYCGRVEVADIGFPPVSLKQAGQTAFTCGEEDMERIPKRQSYSNKGTFGKVLVVAGSVDMCGAAYLSGLAAYRMGAGLVKIMTVEENRQILQELLPEAVLSSYDSSQVEVKPEEFSRRVERECAWADVIVLGPGIGRASYAERLVQEFMMNAYVPMIIDADGLNIIAERPELTQYFTENIIITPHLGEMARLTGLTIPEIQSNLIKTAADYSGRFGIQCVLKDAATVVTGRDGQCYINSSGNSSMAKAGSGDVLTGVIAGLLGLGMDIWDGAVLGVYLHGAAGDRVRQRMGAHGPLARNLADEIGNLSI